jgi:WD40 repeat protein
VKLPSTRLLSLAAVLGLAIAAGGCSSGGSATATSTAAPTAASTPAATASATPAPTPVATASPTPAASTPVITAANAQRLAVAASAHLDSFARSTWTRSAHGLEFDALGQAGLVRVDVATGQAAAPVDLSAHGMLIGVAPDGHTFAFATASDGVHVWDAATGKDVATLDPGANARSSVGSAVFTADGKTVALVHVDTIDATLWDVATAKQVGDLHGFQTAAPVYSIRLDATGSEVAWVARATVQFMDAKTNTLGAKLSFEQFVATAEFLPGGTFLTAVPGSDAAGKNAMAVSTWDVKTGKQLSTFAIPGFTAGVAISPDGKLVAAGTQDAVVVWELATGHEVASLPVPTGAPARLQGFSPDGTTLASSLQDGTLQFLQVK